MEETEMLRSTRFVVAALCALAACSKDAASTNAERNTPPAAGDNAKKPCEYLARADAEAALELPLPGTTETEVTGECNYHTSEFYGVTFAIGTWDGVLLSANSGGQQHPPKPIAGLGDGRSAWATTSTSGRASAV